MQLSAIRARIVPVVVLSFLAIGSRVQAQETSREIALVQELNRAAQAHLRTGGSERFWNGPEREEVRRACEQLQGVFKQKGGDFRSRNPGSFNWSPAGAALVSGACSSELDITYFARQAKETAVRSWKRRLGGGTELCILEWGDRAHWCGNIVSNNPDDESVRIKVTKVRIANAAQINPSKCTGNEALSNSRSFQEITLSYDCIRAPEF